jgi:transposase InsO family protein
MSELCRRFSISRKTGYKWLKRFHEAGVIGLKDKSRAPTHQPMRTPTELERVILDCRDRYPDWGARKLHRILTTEGYRDLPVASTITEILRRHDKLKAPLKPQRAYIRFEHPHPNDLWQMDFKGHFKVGQGRCHPLTVLDDHSRYSLCLQACSNEQTLTVQHALILTFRCYGLPRRMTMDNGSPWGGGGTSRFSKLTVWLIEQGITVGYSRPYHPQTQGKDERFHRTLKAEVLGRREFESMARCQSAFDTWRAQYNRIRPHEALAMETPSSRYQASQRPYNETLRPYDYGDTDQIRRISSDQSASFHNYRVPVGEAFVGKHIAFRPTLIDGQYTLHFCHQTIGKINLNEITKR